jgi:AcrR family transcriptional regulator
MSARGPYAKGIAKREEILQIALELFAQKGYDRVSVREIARETGLSQAGLLHHFSTKEELFLEVLRRRDDRDGDPVEHKHVHSVDHLIAAVEHNAQEPGLVRLFVSMSAESTEDGSPAREFFVARYRWLRGEVAADVRRRQEAGELAADLDPDEVASLLIAVADGLQLQWLLEPEKVDMGHLMTTFWSTLGRAR